jgi:hypothetical protein
MFDIFRSFGFSLHICFQIFDILVLLFHLVGLHLFPNVVFGGCGLVKVFSFDENLVDVLVGVYACHFEGLLAGGGGIAADLRYQICDVLFHSKAAT